MAETHFCDVCTDELSNCIIYPCNHTICWKCMPKIIKHNNTNKCSVCEKNIEQIMFQENIQSDEGTRLIQNKQQSYSDKLDPLLFYSISRFHEMREVHRFFVILCTGCYYTLYFAYGIIILNKKADDPAHGHWLAISVPVVFLSFDLIKIIFGVISVDLPEFSIVQDVSKEEREDRQSLNFIIISRCFICCLVSVVFCVLTFNINSIDSRLFFSEVWIIIIVVIMICNMFVELSLIQGIDYWDGKYNSQEMIDDAV